jgi:hypothetical protein
MAGGNIFGQIFYRARQISALGELTHDTCSIEDRNGNILGYASKPLLRDSLIVSRDREVRDELIVLKGEGLFGNKYDIIDPNTGKNFGYFKQKTSSDLVRADWELYNPDDVCIGRIYEKSFIGSLISKLPLDPMLNAKQLAFEVHGRVVTEINQKVSLLNDSWEMDCSNVPSDIDGRIMISALILMREKR